MWNLNTDQTQVVAKHDAPIRHLFHVKDMNNMLVTGSWDKTLRYWDLRQPNPIHTQQLPERVYAMDVNYPLLVVGLANRKIQVGWQPLCRCLVWSFIILLHTQDMVHMVISYPHLIASLHTW